MNRKSQASCAILSGKPAICILDSGVNNEHPLLRPALDVSDMHACDPAWGEADHDDHGTEMAGLALYGDLTELLSHYDQIALSHRLESVKILPPHGINPPHLYGDITAEAIARSEVTAPHRSRIVCMAVSTTDFRDRGRPSSWIFIKGTQYDDYAEKSLF